MAALAFAKAIKTKLINLTQENVKFLNTFYQTDKMPDPCSEVPTIFGLKLNQSLLIERD